LRATGDAGEVSASLAIDHRDGVTHATLRGDLREEAIAGVERRLGEAGRGVTVILDVGGVERFEAPALAMLRNLGRMLRQVGSQLELVAPAGSSAHAALAPLGDELTLRDAVAVESA
jgi:ABC-type transporter Mla MlaB component